jgi:hypothetical protein
MQRMRTTTIIITSSWEGFLKMKKNQKPELLYFNPDEVKAVVLGLQTVIGDIEPQLNDQRYNWTPEARKSQREIITACRGALSKLERQLNGGKPFSHVPPYKRGDEDEFLTKES